MKFKNLSIFLVSLLLFVATGHSTEKPNIIVILTDDLGYNDFGCYGAKDLATPQIDKMASEGVKFTSFYVSPVCSPTRASLMTGCHPQRVGIGGVLFQRNTVGLSLEEQTLPELLKKQDYATALIGKWHLGFLSSQNPLHHGFDYWYGTLSSNSTNIDPFDQEFAKDCIYREGLTKVTARESKSIRSPLLRNNKMIEVPADQTQFTKRYTEETIEFIAQNKNKPFFIYLAHNMPHIPLFASEKFLGTSKRGLYGDVIEELDWGIGEVLKALKAHGLDEKTLVVLTSDNGPKTSVGGSAQPLRGEKGDSFEGGVRVPCIMRWPRKIPCNRINNEPITVMDLLPTMVNLAGGSVPTDLVIDGKDIWPVISEAEGAKSPHEAIYYLKGRSLKGIRVGDWKLITGIEGDSPKLTIELTKEERKLPRDQRKALIKEKRKALGIKKETTNALFNLREDIGEQQNRIQQHPEIAERLQKMMNQFHAELHANQRPAGDGK